MDAAVRTGRVDFSITIFGPFATAAMLRAANSQFWIITKHMRRDRASRRKCKAPYLEISGTTSTDTKHFSRRINRYENHFGFDDRFVYFRREKQISIQSHTSQSAAAAQRRTAADPTLLLSANFFHDFIQSRFITNTINNQMDMSCRACILRIRPHLHR